MQNKFVGIDYSMTSPGMTTFIDGMFTSYFFTTNRKQIGLFFKQGNHSFIGILYPEWTTPEERFDKISSEILCEYPLAPKMTVIEGYSFGSTSSNLFQIAENCGALKMKLYHKGIPFTTAAPSEIKKYATTKGNAKKEDMYDAFLKKTGIDLQTAFNKKVGSKIGSPVGDIVDSYFMCCFAMEKYS